MTTKYTSKLTDIINQNSFTDEFKNGDPMKIGKLRIKKFTSRNYKDFIDSIYFEDLTTAKKAA